MYPFVLEVARRGDEALLGRIGAGGVGVGLQIFNNKNCKKSLRATVNHAIIESNRSMAMSTSAPGSAISRERVIPSRRRSVKCGLVGYAGKERDQ